MAEIFPAYGDARYDLGLLAALTSMDARIGDPVDPMPSDSATASGTSLVVVLAVARSDTAYIVTVSPSWDTTWWVTDRAVDQFTVHFGTASDGSLFDWYLTAQVV